MMDKVRRLRYQGTNGPLVVRPVTAQPMGHKPDGLWYSVGEEWRDWCLSEHFQTSGLGFVYELAVDLGRILRITSARELRAFADEFAATTWDVDWPAVARRWDGIEIAPYLWECRHDYDTRWYYSWDVASGCLWRPEALLDARQHSEDAAR